MTYMRSRIFLLCVAISGFGSVVYFVNRVAYANIAISWVQMVIIMGVVGDEGIRELKARGNSKNEFYVSRTVSKLVLLFYVFIFAVEGGLGLEPTIQKRILTTWNTEAIEEFKSSEAQEINQIPSMLAFGFGVPELFFQIHRNDTEVIMDWADINEENIRRVDELIEEYTEQEKPVFVSDFNWVENYNWAEKVRSKGYEVAKEYEISGRQFWLLKPIKN